MATSYLINSKFGDTAASTTAYFPLGITTTGNANGHATEANTNVPFRTPGKISNLWCKIKANDRGASTLKVRINSADGAQAISIGASATGKFQDSTNTDTIAAGDRVCTQLVTGSGGTTFVMNSVNALFLPTDASTTISKLIATSPAENCSVSGVSTTYYHRIADSLAASPSTSETGIPFKVSVNGNLKFLSCFVTSNARVSSATTIGSRKNNGNGNLSVSVGISATGLFEDTTNSDTLVSGDTINYYETTGIGAGAIVISYISTALQTQDGRFQNVTSSVNTNLANTTAYYALTDLNRTTTESDVQVTANKTFTASALYYKCNTNTVTNASTLTFRKNATNGNLSISIPGSSTGVFADTTHTDSVAPTDELSYKLLLGTTGTSQQASDIGIVMQEPGGSCFFMWAGI